MIALETLRNSLPDSDILSPWHLLALDRSWGRARWADLLQPGPGRAGASMPMKTMLSWPGKCSESMASTQWPLCHLLGWSMDPDILLMLAVGGGVISQVPSWQVRGLPPQPVVLVPPPEAKDCFIQSGLHGNRPDSVNPHFPCFQQTRFMGISGIPVQVKTRVSLSICWVH